MRSTQIVLNRTGQNALSSALCHVLAGAVSLGLMVAGEPAAESEPAAVPVPHFQEVLRLLRTNLSGVSEEELNAAMVKGLTESFGARVKWVNRTAPPVSEPTSGLRRTAVYGENVGYLGIVGVVEGLGEELAAAKAGLRSSNELKGWVLDLRFASGSDARAAAAAADQFVDSGHPLVQFDDVAARSTDAGDAEYPLVVLVNSETRGAAEALAGALREAGPAVVLGSRTAGQAYAMRAFDLEQGGQLLIASAPVLVGEGVSLENGLVPDLEVPAAVAQERLWIEDPYRVPEGEESRTLASANRINEAALVAEHEGLTNPPVAARRTPQVQNAETVPALRDVALVRALSLLKGLARVRQGILR